MRPPPHVTTATRQASQSAGTAVSVFPLVAFVIVRLIAWTALTNPTLGRIAPLAKRRTPCPAQVFLATVQKSAMELHHVQMLGTSCSPLARRTRPAAARRTASFSATTGPGVLLAR